MRLALVSFEFPPVTPGGIGTYAWHAVRALTEAGHTIEVFAGGAADPRDEAYTRLCAGRARIHRLGGGHRAFSGTAIPALAERHRAQPFDAAEVPDLYAEGAGLRTAVPGLPFLLRCHTPSYIPTEVDLAALPRAARLLQGLRRGLGAARHRRRGAWREALAGAGFRRAAANAPEPERTVAFEADLIVPPSHRLGHRLIRDWRLPPDRVALLPYAHFPDPALAALPPPREARVISFHGGIRRFKGVHVLAAALPAVLGAHRELRLQLAGHVGTSPVPDVSWAAWKADRMLVWRDTMDWLAPQLAPWRDRLTLAGPLPPEKIPSFIAAADICVFPSLFDNFPSACLEAMAAGRAIVATRSGGMEEMLGHDEAGLLVPPGDAPALARAINRLVDDPALRLRLAGQARTRLRALCDPAAIATRHAALFARIIERRQGAASPGAR